MKITTGSIVATAVVAGVLIGLAPSRWDVIIALGVLVVMAALVGGLMRTPQPKKPRTRYTPRQLLALASLYLVLVSTLVFRVRTATDIADNPLDLAGTFRVATLGAAFAIACLSMVATRLSWRRVPWPARFYAGYVAVIPLGMITAVSRSIVMFKWIELLVMLVVWFALSTAFVGRMQIPLRHLGIFLGLMVGAILVNLTLYSDAVLISLPQGLLPIQLVTIYPQQSANEVGALGAVIVAFGLGRRQPSPGLVALGVALVLAAQYRTGYVSLLVMVLLFLAFRRQATARVALAVLVLALPMFLQTSTFEEAWVRGESHQTVTTLTGRTVWWGEAIDATARSPIFGIGLSSGVRYEVLEARFNGLTSTIHSTWIESFVGTGVVGLALLASAMASGLVVSWRYARRGGDLLPLLLMGLLTVRSITSSTIDIGGYTVMLFLIAVTVASQAPDRTEAPARGDPGEPVAVGT